MINSGFTAEMTAGLTEQFIAELTMKRLDVGYADNQPKFPYWAQPVNYSRKEWDKMGDWVVKTFGNGDWITEHGLWVGSDRKYWFRDERDRTLFILKWS